MPKRLFAVGLAAAFGAGAGFYAGYLVALNAPNNRAEQERQNGSIGEEGPLPSDYPVLPDINLHKP